MTATQDFRLTAFAATKTGGQTDRLEQASTLAPRQTESAESARSTATAVVRSFYESILNIERDGVVGNHEGEFIALPDFHRDEARRNYMFFHDTEYNAANFVVETDLQWESASMTADWPTSGCGFVYGQNEREYLFTFLSLDGFVYTMRHLDSGDWKYLSAERWGTPDLPKGRAKFLLAVWDRRATVYVNDARISSVYDGAYRFGIINLTVVSGTNKGFGTRCIFNGPKLFILE